MSLDSGGEGQRQVVICGLVRNGERTLRRDVLRILASTGQNDKVSFFLVESDSDDGTLSTLESLAKAVPNFSFISLGRLEAIIPERVDRIAHCRNSYLEYIEREMQLGSDAWLVVADFDNLNNKLQRNSIQDSISSNIADAYFPNQVGPYYDIYALRHKIWNPGNSWEEYDHLTSLGMGKRLAYEIAIKSKMIRINRHDNPIFVDSAFGGLGIYRAALVSGLRYSSRSNDGRLVCEHVSFNQAVSDRGGVLAILPNLINAGYTQHTRYFKVTSKAVRPLVRFVRSVLVKLTSEALVDKAYKFFT